MIFSGLFRQNVNQINKVCYSDYVFISALNGEPEKFFYVAKTSVVDGVVFSVRVDLA